MILKSDNRIGPYWNLPLKGSGGRDHLGMQSTSIAIYSFLLPGLSNLTQRLRYYSFYCWVVEQYALNIKNSSRKTFNAFIRKAELLFSFVAIVYNDNQFAVMGSDFTKKYLKENDFSNDNLIIDLNKEANPTDKNKKTYWKHSGGAFAQYYQGPLFAIKVLGKSPNHDIPVVTTYGRKLYEAFENVLKSDNSKLLVKFITEGQIKVKDLKYFGKIISPENIEIGNDEHNLLLDLIMSGNLHQGAEMRVETFRLLFKYLKDKKILTDWKDITQYFYYQSDFKSINEIIVNAWKLYQINEYMHYSLETLFNYLLEHARHINQWLSIDELTEDMKSKFFKNIKHYKEIKITEQDSVSHLIELLKEHNQKKKDQEGSPAWYIGQIKTQVWNEMNIVNAFLCIFSLFSRHSDEYNELYKFGEQHDIIRFGSFLDVLSFYNNNKNQTMSQFIKKTICHKILNRHLEVAYKKLAVEKKDTLKFAYDNNFILGLHKVDAVWNTPRLRSAINFIKDLSIIDENGKITEYGNKIIEKYFNG